MGVNIALLKRDIDKFVDRSIYPTAKRRIEKEVEGYKQELLKEFNSSPVTKELRAASGPGGDRVTSTYLVNGNLYGLIGFTHEHGDPTEPIREGIEKYINIASIQKKPTNDKMVYRVEARVTMPTMDEFEQIAGAAHPLEWTGRSWLDMIKRGVGGFQRTIFKSVKDGSSESTMALQSKSGNIRANTFNGVGRYLQDFLAEFREKIRAKNS